ncbi:hypothetical protein ABKN59_002910 [Abortiporus biennis]
MTMSHSSSTTRKSKKQSSTNRNSNNVRQNVAKSVIKKKAKSRKGAVKARMEVLTSELDGQYAQIKAAGLSTKPNVPLQGNSSGISDSTVQSLTQTSYTDTGTPAYKMTTLLCEAGVNLTPGEFNIHYFMCSRQSIVQCTVSLPKLPPCTRL